MMSLDEAMQYRHTVREYKKTPIPDDVAKQLRDRIKANNEEFGLEMRLVTGSGDAISALFKFVKTKNVNNYIVLAAKNGKDIEEKLGYCGADLMLYAQTLGLNSWWVGGTINKGAARTTGHIPDGCRITGVIVLGYGETQGVPHKSKKPEDIAKYYGDAPYWFVRSVGAVLLAPTAMNKQDFKIRGDGNKVLIGTGGGAMAKTDLGIAKYFFEVGAGKENFVWNNE